MENHYNCIYMYTNKINGKGYVGQAINFNKRHRKHIYAITNENDNEYDYPIQRAFRKYGLDNFEVKILKENLNTQCLLNFYECYYIKKFDLLCKNGKGYNLSDGGSNGNPFAGKTEEEMEETKQKKSEAMKGKYHTEETKQKMSEAKKGENHPMYGVHRYGKDNPMYGKKHSEETKQKMSEAKKGEKNNSLAKKVAQYDKQGNLIKIWGSLMDIQRELGIKCSNICNCCKGKRKSAGGYIWRYAEETE